MAILWPRGTSTSSTSNEVCLLTATPVRPAGTERDTLWRELEWTAMLNPRPSHICIEWLLRAKINSEDMFLVHKALIL